MKWIVFQKNSTGPYPQVRESWKMLAGGYQVSPASVVSSETPSKKTAKVPAALKEKQNKKKEKVAVDSKETQDKKVIESADSKETQDKKKGKRPVDSKRDIAS